MQKFRLAEINISGVALHHQHHHHQMVSNISPQREEITSD